MLVVERVQASRGMGRRGNIGHHKKRRRATDSELHRQRMPVLRQRLEASYCLLIEIPMKVKKGYKFRVYPTEEQIRILEINFDASRFVYNHFLALREEAYEERKETVNFYSCSNILTEIKDSNDYNWLNSADSHGLQQSLRDLDSAFKNFFRRVKNSEPPYGFPKFRTKDGRQRYRTVNAHGTSIRIENEKVRIPTVGFIKSRGIQMFRGRILNAAIEKTNTGKYFCSLCVEEELEIKENNGGAIGIDVGIKEFYTDSNGDKVDNPTPLRKLEDKLIREQRKLSRMQKGSNNYKKQKQKLARVHEQIANQRKDFLHKESTKLVRDNQIIAVEDLNIKGMVRNHKLAKSVSDASWGEFFRQLEYKSFEHGADFVKIDRFYASSQTCSCCGFKNEAVKDLKVRRWVCPNCGAEHDRDANAATNILNEGLRILKEKETA